MGFQDAIRAGLRQYATFAGRASRSEYWYFALFIVLGAAGLSIVDSILFGDDPATGKPRHVISALFQLATVVPLLAVGWRRMHDSGRPGWYNLLPMLVSIGIVVLLLGGAAMVGMAGMMPHPGPQAQGGMAAAGLLAGGIFVVTLMVLQLALALLMLWWLTRPSDPDANAYGPPPKP
ncbi:MAG: DUF805 domain-containing protein [Roseivivax sp.]|nr:DUF805 domain-containing protein [Roseivivax sp.]